MTLTVIHAQERKTPKNRERISWKLITDLVVKTKAQAIEKLRWYAMRWKIESVPQAHKVEIKGIISKYSKAIGKMMVGPSKSVVRSGFQTTPSGCH